MRLSSCPFEPVAKTVKDYRFRCLDGDLLRPARILFYFSAWMDSTLGLGFYSTLMNDLGAEEPDIGASLMSGLVGNDVLSLVG